MRLAFEGNGPKEIAQAVGMTREAVGLIMRAPIFQHAIAQMRQRQDGAMVEQSVEDTQRARTVLEQASVQAAKTQVEIMASPEVKPGIRLQAADSILDRVLGRSSPEAAVPMVINTQMVQLLQLAVRESFGREGPALELGAPAES
jgi:hypothetical protein